jgi:enoyl-CoA hydratase
VSGDLVLLEVVSPSTSVLTIHRPEALNALNLEVLDALGTAIFQARRDGVRQLVVTGAGKAFVAGADIKAMRDLDRATAKEFARRGQRIIHLLSTFSGVTIAAVNGYALGGGMELAMACDLIIADERAKFGQPEVGLGVIPGFGGTQRLRRLVGAMRARELIFTGRTFGAEEAVRLGLALETVPTGTALEAGKALAARIEAQGPLAVRWAKAACKVSEEFNIEVGLQEEAGLFGRCFDTADQTEGMAAFVEKRAARFVGQ